MLKLVLICTAVVTMLMVNPVIAQQKGGNLKQQIVGTWSLVSQYVDEDGGKEDGTLWLQTQGHGDLRTQWQVCNDHYTHNPSQNCLQQRHDRDGG